MNKIIRWGILGTGGIASKFATEIKATQNGVVKAVGSRTLEKAFDFASKHQIEFPYGSYDELIFSNEIDAVYVATPHNLHLENVLQCFDGRKHVLCEKPMAVNLEQTLAIIEVAKAKNLYLMEAMWTLFLPPICKAMEWIKSGKIGEVQSLTAEFGFVANSNPLGRHLNPHLAGGALLDIGVYVIAFAHHIFEAKPQKIIADGFIGKTGVDIYDAISMNFGDGKFANLTVSLKTQFADSAIIYGSEGYIVIENFWRSKKATLIPHLGNSETFIDSRSTDGYNFEIEAVNNDLLANKCEDAIMPLQKSLEIATSINEVKNQIGLRYPFE